MPYHPDYPHEDQTCANCAHCGQEHNLTVYAKGYRATAEERTLTLHVCEVAALEPDVYGAVALVSPESSCHNDAGEWMPSEAYLAKLDAELDADVAEAAAVAYALDLAADIYNGVRPGEDCPGKQNKNTYGSLNLSRPHHAA